MQQRITKNLIIKQMQNLKSLFDPKVYKFIDRVQADIIATKGREKRNTFFREFLVIMRKIKIS